MSDVAAAAELRMLAHTLDVDAERIDMLDGIPPADLRALRHQISAGLFEADRHYFVRVAALAKAVPVAVAAKLTELTLPPLIAARTTELLEPRRAAEIVAKLSDRYLADVSAVMDASRSPEVVAAIPPDRVAKVGVELARRGEWVVIGAFIAHLDDTALRRSSAEYAGEQLLRISFVVEDVDRLDPLGGMLRDDQLDGILRAAAGVPLWAELAHLLEHLSPERRARWRARFEQLPPEVQAEYERAPDAVRTVLVD